MVKMINKRVFWVTLVFFGCISFMASTVHSGSFADLPVKGMVTMVDLGAKKCIPCKMMAPILVKMEKVYKDKAVIAFIDVWENKSQAQRFGIRGIPTQIFFNEEGKEVYRHIGFMSEKDIKAQLKKMGIDPPDEKKN
jgi:thioredoxin 1